MSRRFTAAHLLCHAPERSLPPDRTHAPAQRHARTGGRRHACSLTRLSCESPSDGDGPDWLSAQPLPETARQQITVALAMIDALRLQIAPLDCQLRPYARASGPDPLDDPDIANSDALYRRLSDSGPSMVAVDLETGERRPPAAHSNRTTTASRCSAAVCWMRRVSVPTT